MTRGRPHYPARIAGLVAVCGIGAAGIIWPAVDRFLLAAVTVALVLGAVTVLGYVAWTGWAELLRGTRRRLDDQRERGPR